MYLYMCIDIYALNEQHTRLKCTEPLVTLKSHFENDYQ